MADPKTITLVSPEGRATDVPAEQAQQWLDRGFTPQSTEARAVDVGRDARDAQTSTASTIRSGLLRGATLGLSDVAQRALGGEDARLELEDQIRAHGTAAGLSNIVGAVAPALLTGGASLAEGGAELGGLAAAGDIAAVGSEARGALSSVAGALPVSLASRAGAGVSEALGGRLLGKVAGGAVEGGLFGAGQGISDAALSQDPLTAENIIGHVSSDALLGAGLGGGLSLLSHGVGAALDRASGAMRDAAEAKGVLAGVPGDLATLDEDGLKAELKRATAAHELDKEAEVSSLESLRREQRTELANQIIDTHEEVRAAKIHMSVNDELADNAGVEKIDGIKLAQRQLADSNAQLSRFSKNIKGLADSPGKAIDALQKRQLALETIQEQMPKLRTALADNAAGAGLEHVDAALEQTKAQIEAIRALDSKANPVTSTRLQLMKAGPSQRMEQVAAAQKALADGKELGIVGKGVKNIASSTASGLAHLLPIPGSSFAAHWMGEKAGSAVEWLARKLSGTASKAAAATEGHVSSFLDVAAKTSRALKAPAIASTTRTLASTRFGDGADAKSGDMNELFRARSAELKRQTMYAQQPDGTTAVVMKPEARAEMARTFDGLRGSHPVLADKLETTAARRVAVQSQALPRKPDQPAGQPQIGPDKWSPSDLQIRRWARVVRATEDPESVERGLAAGIVTPEEAKAYREVYPERFAALQRQIFDQLPTLSKTLPMRKKVALSIFTGIPVTPAMRPEILATLQRSFAVEPGSKGGTQAPRPEANFGRFGSLKDQDKPTPSQERQR